MKDRNGREIGIGDMVIHAEAKTIDKWPGPGEDSFPRRKDGTTPPCPPFLGTHRVKEIVSTTCVRLDPLAGIIPVFLGCALEVVGDADERQ